MERVLVNLSSRVKRIVREGRSFLVAPMVLLKPQVLNGSKGPLLYPKDQIAKSAPDWDGVPMVVYHPVRNGQHVSAEHSDVLRKTGIGLVKHPFTDKQGVLKGYGWFDVEKTQKVAPSILRNLEAGNPIELSTGLFTENIPAPPNASFQSQPYTHIATDYKADHLAILPDQTGACSLRDGCGVLANGLSDEYGSCTLNAELPPNATLDKPFRTPDGPKKFAVYTKGENGGVVLVRFGDPNMEIKRDNPERRKSFRARHGCDTDPRPKWKPKYWSCKFWEKGKSVGELTNSSSHSLKGKLQSSLTARSLKSRVQEALVNALEQQLSVNDRWVTIRGTHVMVRTGQTKEQAVAAFLDRQKKEESTNPSQPSLQPVKSSTAPPSPTPKPQAASNSPSPKTPSSKPQPLSSAEKASVQAYTDTDAYSKIRKCQNEGKGCTDKTKSQIENLSSALSKLPKHNGKVYRGMNFGSPEERDKFLAGVEKNGGLVDKGFTSTTVSEKAAYDFAAKHRFDGVGAIADKCVVIRLVSKTGADISSLSKYGKDEKEVLMPPNSRWNLKGMSKKTYGKNPAKHLVVLDMEES